VGPLQADIKGVRFGVEPPQAVREGPTEGVLTTRRKPPQAPAALVAPSSVYSSADKVGHTMPYTQQREGRINKLSQTAHIAD